MIVGNEDEHVLKYVPPPELHLLIGPQYMLEYLKPDSPEIAEQWIKNSSVLLDHYQRLNGNNARKLLNKVELLEHLSPSKANYLKVQLCKICLIIFSFNYFR